MVKCSMRSQVRRHVHVHMYSLTCSRCDHDEVFESEGRRPKERLACVPESGKPARFLVFGFSQLGLEKTTEEGTPEPDKSG